VWSASHPGCFNPRKSVHILSGRYAGRVGLKWRVCLNSIIWWTVIRREVRDLIWISVRIIGGNKYGISLSKLKATHKHHYATLQILPSINTSHQMKWMLFRKGLTSYITVFLRYQYHHHHHHHHKHPGLGHLARSVSRVTVALSIIPSVSQLFSFLVGCSGMILKGFGFVAFFADVKASSFCIHLSYLVCCLSVVRCEWSRLFCGISIFECQNYRILMNVRFTSQSSDTDLGNWNFLYFCNAKCPKGGFTHSMPRPCRSPAMPCR
jgi:hypothetical protein